MIEHSWMPHDEFKALGATMDLGLQVSFTETFNIVAADLADENVPVVVSTEIGWTCGECQVCDITSESIEKTMQMVWANRFQVAAMNKRNLVRFGANSRKAWKEALS
jgi:hypothetical protein